MELFLTDLNKDNVASCEAERSKCPYITTNQQSECQGLLTFSITLAPVVQTMDSAVHRINYYPADKHSQNQLSYPVDSDLSRG